MGLRLPSSFGFGVSWRPTDVLTLSADYTRSGWSDATVNDFFEVSKRPRDDADGDPAPAPAPVFLDPAFYPTLTDVDSTEVARRQVDSEQFRLGLEYVLIKGRLKIPLRAGYFSDRQIKPNPDGKGPRYDGVTAGIGLVLGPMLLDVAYVHEFGEYSHARGRKRVRSGAQRPAPAQPALLGHREPHVHVDHLPLRHAPLKPRGHAAVR